MYWGLLLLSVAKLCPALWPNEMQHARLPCPSPSLRACSNSCPLSQWCYPTILSSVAPLLLLPSIFPSIRVFSSDPVLHIRWPKYWSFSFNISPSNEYSELISFRIDWLDLLAIQGTPNSVPKHHSLKIIKVKIELLFSKRGQLSHRTCSVNIINIC